MNKNFGIVLTTYIGDFYLTKGLLASIKKFLPELPICIIQDGDFSLEVSSPGVDEPLLQQRQYTKNVGRTVAVTTNDGVEKTGVMTAATDEHITLEIKGAKAKDPLIVAEIPFSNIKKTVVQIIF